MRRVRNHRVRRAIASSAAPSRASRADRANAPDRLGIGICSPPRIGTDAAAVGHAALAARRWRVRSVRRGSQRAGRRGLWRIRTP
ncbi:hypothetical protein [Lysobacter gummosus]|uniref:hypothetical protein n=1 Tax=Lysobacter gummosus TaxID=262324 RepID=UPI003642C4F8